MMLLQQHKRFDVLDFSYHIMKVQRYDEKEEVIKQIVSWTETLFFVCDIFWSGTMMLNTGQLFGVFVVSKLLCNCPVLRLITFTAC